MWQLHTVAKTGGPRWSLVGSFDSITAAGRRIVELEEYPVAGLHLEVHIDCTADGDSDALTIFEHTGQRALYAIKRVMQ